MRYNVIAFDLRNVCLVPFAAFACRVEASAVGERVKTVLGPRHVMCSSCGLETSTHEIKRKDPRLQLSLDLVSGFALVWFAVYACARAAVEESAAAESAAVEE
eukprot:2672045-Rhodomonas_salina.1